MRIIGNISVTGNVVIIGVYKYFFHLTIPESLGPQQASQLVMVFFWGGVSWPFLQPLPTAYGGSQARGPVRAIAAGLCQSHSNMGSEPHLKPTPQLTAMPDP